MVFEEEPVLKIIIAPGQGQSRQITIPNACDFDECLIDVLWEDPPGSLAIEWANCRFEPNPFADAGG
jgi:hypothetical protein